jgi:hypothetical protein
VWELAIMFTSPAFSGRIKRQAPYVMQTAVTVKIIIKFAIFFNFNLNWTAIHLRGGVGDYQGGKVLTHEDPQHCGGSWTIRVQFLFPQSFTTTGTTEVRGSSSIATNMY